MVAAELRAEPSLLGIGPTTGDEGSGMGVGVATDLGGSSGVLLQATSRAATALDTVATSQKRRGAAVKGSCLMVRKV